MIRLFHLIIAFSLCLTNLTLTIDAHARDRQSIIQETQRFVYTINGYDHRGNFQSSGSGFAAADGRIVTNAHVVEGLHQLEILDHEGRELGIVRHVEAISFDWDLAILPRLSSVSDAGLYLTTEPVKTGQDIIVFGSPMGFYGTVSSGMISSIRELEDMTLLQMTAPISAGSSGGPVVDLDGNVCGVSTLTLIDAQNLNFAVSSNEVMSLLIRQPGVYLLPLHNNESQENQDENVVVSFLEVISQPLDKNSTRRGVLNPVTDEFGDTVFDAWAIELNVGDEVEIAAESNEFDPKISFIGQFAGDDVQLEIEDDDSGYGLNSLLRWTCNQSGVYYLLITSANGEFGNYQVSNKCESQMSNNPITPLNCFKDVTGILLQSETYDRYSIHLNSGDFFTVRTESNEFDPELWLMGDFNEEGKAKIVLRNDDEGNSLNSYLSHVCEVSGEYMVSVGSMQGRGSYRLYAELFGPEEMFASIMESSRRLTPGEVIEGNLLDGVDVYQLSLVKGQHVSIKMNADGFDADLILFGQLDSNGDYRVKLNDKDNKDHVDGKIEWSCSASGDYLVIANSEGDKGGHYTIEVRMKTTARANDILINESGNSRWFLSEREIIIPQQKYRVSVLRQFHKHQSNREIELYDACIIHYEIYPKSKESKILSTQYMLDSKTIYAEKPPHYRNGAQVISKGSIEEEVMHRLSAKN